MEEYVIKSGKKLRLGYTTGSCAAAAAKAAAWMLLSGRKKEEISIVTPNQKTLHLPVSHIKMGEDEVSCAVQKDSGDDPDITDKAYIVASVRKTEGEIVIDGGSGVGRVTKKGLDQPVGAAAINSVPRQMILEAVKEVCQTFDYHLGLSIIISVPGGEALAQKTFNPRLGIIGGISILGTSGIVEPMSEDALIETIRIELKQRRETGHAYALITPGNYGSDFIKKSLGLDEKAAVLSSNYIGDTLDICKELGFNGILLIGHIGKLIKLCGGMMNTHSKYGDCRMEIMAAYAAACGLKASAVCEMLNCATCDDGIRILKENDIFLPVMEKIISRIEFHLSERAKPAAIGVVVFSNQYGLLAKSGCSDDLLNKIMEEM